MYATSYPHEEDSLVLLCCSPDTSKQQRGTPGSAALDRRARSWSEPAAGFDAGNRCRNGPAPRTAGVRRGRHRRRPASSPWRSGSTLSWARSSGCWSSTSTGTTTPCLTRPRSSAEGLPPPSRRRVGSTSRHAASVWLTYWASLRRLVWGASQTCVLSHVGLPPAPSGRDDGNNGGEEAWLTPKPELVGDAVPYMWEVAEEERCGDDAVLRVEKHVTIITMHL